MKRLINSFLFFLCFYSAFSQRCAQREISSAELKQRHENFQVLLDNYQQNNSKNVRQQEEIIRIPVVVHVIHNEPSRRIGGENNTNISDEQIFSQIKVLNEDFRKEFGTRGYNENPVGADMEIEFFLAQQDPNGQPSSGINRVYYNKSNYDVFSDLELISSLSYWPSDKYLNIWVVNFSGSYLGYGEFPGGALDGLELTDPPEETDGVFIDYEVFGDRTGTASSGVYSYGRTTTHEIGHWLGLLHTWGDVRCGTDYCDDTPQIQGANDTETCRQISSRCNGEFTINMIENYMDYTPDSCMNIFTNDQKARVRAALEVSQRRRRLVLNSQFLLPATNLTEFNIINNPGNSSMLSFQVLLPDFQDFTLSGYNLLGQQILYKEFKDYPSTVVRAEDLNLPTGPLIIRMQTGNEIFTKRIVLF